MTTSVVPNPQPQVDMTAWDLVTAAQNGDRDAFGQLYDRYVDLVFRYVHARVNDRPLAEDLTSETFLRALRWLDSVNYRGKDVAAWFTTIARNLVLDHVKSSRYRLEVNVAEVFDVREHPGPEREVLAREVQRVLWSAVGELSAAQCGCLVLRYMHGLSVTETAAALGCPEGSVKARTYRGIRTLAAMPELTVLRG